jgi:hypothetical protein
MAITNIESTGLNSLFQASSALAKQTIEANVPSQKENMLKADNRSLTRENFSLEAQNKLLEEQNSELENDNRDLSRQVSESQIEQPQRLNDNSSQQETRSEEKAKAADDISFTQNTPVNTAPQPTEAATVNSYTPTAGVSGIDLGSSFNSFA